MSADDWSEWARIAEQDWQLAVSLLRRKRPTPAHIAFLAQQSAEKYLKALLLSRRIAFPKTHDLRALNALCEQAGIWTGFRGSDLLFLSDCAVTTRYPGNEPTLDEARQAVEIARAVRAFARRFLTAR
ncbi:MAG: HEPN domain-containing protein [Anaerolineales bacterium]|nr:HEPN domain-containing protein [Anaerolineales bacterium]